MTTNGVIAVLMQVPSSAHAEKRRERLCDSDIKRENLLLQSSPSV
jgi:hypothetical protein